MLMFMMWFVVDVDFVAAFGVDGDDIIVVGGVRGNDVFVGVDVDVCVVDGVVDVSVCGVDVSDKVYVDAMAVDVGVFYVVDDDVDVNCVLFVVVHIEFEVDVASDVDDAIVVVPIC